jgi:hypothetical protein
MSVIIYSCCIWATSFGTMGIYRVSAREQNLSTIDTRRASLNLGAFLIVSGHICFAIISSSMGVRLKYIFALFRANRGWTNPWSL